MSETESPDTDTAHHYDVYEVDGAPGSFYARCLCGWEGPWREGGPGKPRAEDDGEEHVETGGQCTARHWTEDKYGNEIRIDCGNGCEY